MGRRKTQEEFNEEIFNLVGNDYAFMEPYINASTKIDVKHSVCNRIYKVKPNTFINGSRCPYCDKENRKGKSYAKITPDIWEEWHKNNTASSFEQVTEFKGLQSNITMKHRECGNIITLKAGSFKKKPSCRYCSHKEGTMKQTKTHDKFCEEVKLYGEDNFEVIEEYKGNHTPIQLKHSVCGNIFKIAPNDFIKGHRCPKCSFKSMRLTQEEWDKRVEELGQGEYEFLEPYKDNMTKIRVEHKVCGTEYSVSPNNFTTGYRCPRCASSRGEKNLEAYLKEKGIHYICQHTFKDLKGEKNPLRFDFYLPDLGILVEYQGLQHYKPVKFFGGEKSYVKQTIRDKYKIEYANKNNIPLIEIPFYVSTPDLIKDKLNYELKKYCGVKQGILNRE